MMTGVSKLLLLAGLLLGGIENAVSMSDYKSRGLSLKSEKGHFLPSSRSKGNSSSKSKSGKSGGSGTAISGNTNAKDENKSGSGKSGKALHVGSDLTVEYTVVESFGSKSSKNSSPSFEYVSSGKKSYKSSSKDDNEMKSGNAGSVSTKESKAGSVSTKESKAGSVSTKESKAGVGSTKSDEVKSTKDSKSSDGVKTTKDSTSSGGVGSIKESKASKDAPNVSLPTGTPPPTDAGTYGVGVPIYSLVYKLTSNNMPTTEDLAELKDVTESYLDDFFTNEFDEDDFTIYSQFITEIDGFTESKNSQVVVSYDSIVRFGQLSLIKPMPEQLGSAIEEAFSGLYLIQYEDSLKKKLSEDNIFLGSKVQYYHGDGVSGTSRIGIAGIAASAAAMTLLVAGVVLYRSKKDDGESDIDKPNKSPGDMTVAGETFAGETYDGTGSVSAASIDYAATANDEEEGTEEDNVRCLSEGEYLDSVKPTWNDANQTEDRGGIFRLAPSKIFSAFKSSVKSAPRTSSFEDVALQAPAYGDRHQDDIMPDPSSSEDDESQMSDSELSQFVANQTSGGHTLEIKSILSQDSIDDNNTDDLSVRDNSSRRMRTVAEIEALLSSQLNDSGSRSFRSIDSSRPRTVEEIESLLTADDDDSVVELPISDGGTIEEC